MAATPDEWLPILAARMDARYPRVLLLRSYGNGHAPMPEMGENVRASWIAFQRKARTNYGGLAVASLADRLRQNGVTVGSESESPESVAARRIWRDNRMDVQLDEVLDDILTVGIGYLVDGDDSGNAVITREKPEQFYAAPDPLRPWKARAGLKVWRDQDAGVDYALVWTPGVRQLYGRMSFVTGLGEVRTERVTAVGNWEPLGQPETYEGPVPIVIFERKDGLGLFEPHIDTIDRINLGKLQRLVTTAMQAFRQRATKGDLPHKDEDDNDIDYSKIFEPAPGALWDLPEGIDIWESKETDIRPMLEAEKADARDFAAETRTPMSAFTPDGANQSAEGAANSAAEQIAQANNEIARIKPALAVALVYALRIEGVEIAEQTVDVSFENPAIVSMSEKYAAAAQAKASGMSWDSIARIVLGWSPEQVAADALARSSEQLSALTLIQAAAPPVAPSVPVT